MSLYFYTLSFSIGILCGCDEQAMHFCNTYRSVHFVNSCEESYLFIVIMTVCWSWTRQTWCR